MNLCSGSRDMRIPSIMNMRMAPETSLSYGKPPGRRHDSDFMGKTSQLATPNLDPGQMGALEHKDTVLGDLGKLKEEGNISPLSPLSTLSSHTALRIEAPSLKGSTIMGQGEISLAMKTQKIISLGEISSIHDRRWWPNMHTLARPRRFWIDDSLPGRTNLQELSSSFDHVQVQRGQQGRNPNLL